MREFCQRKTAVMLVNFTYFPTPLLHMQFNYSVLLYPLVRMQIYCNKFLSLQVNYYDKIFTSVPLAIMRLIVELFYL
jgi:hypothetical protein